MKVAENTLRPRRELHPNPKQRRFCELVVQGNSLADSYSLAYGVAKGFNCTQSASRLEGKQHVRDYIAALRQPVVVETMLDLQTKRVLLRDVVYADAVSLLNDDGSVNMEAVRKLPSHVVQEFSITVRLDKDKNPVRTLKLRLLDKLKAIEVDNYLAGHGAGGNAGITGAEGPEILAARAAARRRAACFITDAKERGLLPEIRVIESG